MKPYFCEHFGNPGSTTHEYGDFANEAVEAARKQVAMLIGAEPCEIIFTSGATEANNLAVQGIAKHLLSRGKNHIITSETEHKSVIDAVDSLVDQGFQITKLKPTEDGKLDLFSLKKAILNRTGLISVMQVNNEIGVINPIQEIGEVAASESIYFHCDAAQSFGKVPISMQDMNIDLLSLSGHKIYGPKGIGVLYVRKSSRKPNLRPMMYGGGQEQGLRSGTLPAPLIVGLGEAARIASIEMFDEEKRVRDLRDQLLSLLAEKISDIVVNGTLENRIANNLNVSFLGINSESLMINLREDIAVSNGSACSTLAPMPSHVLRSMGLGSERIESAIRFGIGRFTSEEEICFAADRIASAIHRLRNKIMKVPLKL